MLESLKPFKILRTFYLFFLLFESLKLFSNLRLVIPNHLCKILTADAPLPLLTWIKADGGGRGFPLRPRLLKCNGNLLASSSNQVAVLSALTSGVPRLLLSYLKKNVLDSDHNALLDSGPHKDPQCVVAMEEGGSSLKSINMVIDRKGRADP